MIALTIVFASLLFIIIAGGRYAFYKHSLYLSKDSSYDFYYTGTNFKGFPVPAKYVFRNVDGDYEYLLHFYNLTHWFNYPHTDPILCNGNNLVSVKGSLVQVFNDMNILTKISYLYHTYYRFMLLVLINEKFKNKNKSKGYKIVSFLDASL